LEALFDPLITQKTCLMPLAKGGETLQWESVSCFFSLVRLMQAATRLANLRHGMRKTTEEEE
jgi:hypothetical protein